MYICKNKNSIESNLDKKCSYCGIIDEAVNRRMFDGLCPKCTDLALFNPDISMSAKQQNKIYKSILKQRI